MCEKHRAPGATRCWAKQQGAFSWKKAGESPKKGVFSSMQEMNGVTGLSPDCVVPLKYSTVQVWCAGYLFIGIGSALS